MRWAALVLALGCGGEAESDTQRTPLCAWEEPLEAECVRLRQAPGSATLFGLEGRTCEPVACLVVPFGQNQGTVQQVEVTPLGMDGPETYEIDRGPCAALACPAAP